MRHRGRAWVVAVLCAIALGSIAGVSVRRIQRARDNAELQRRSTERVREAVATDSVELLAELRRGVP